MERQIRSFVIRSGRMSSAQKRSYDNFFPVFGIKGNETGLLESKKIFGNSNPLVIEIGFGMGKATSLIANLNPEINYLGIEVHKNGIGRLLWEIEKNSLKNIRIVEGDAADILDKRIIDNSVSAFHIFFPDPWPKKRHHKRRLITAPFTGLLARKLLTGGYIYMVSDWADYGEWGLREFTATPALTNRYDTFAKREEWRPETEFERKALQKNHNIYELFFVKNKV